jgi:hypothetical protein
MADYKTQTALTAVPWNADAARLLEGAAGNDPTYTMADVRREVDEGFATLYRVTLGPEVLGYIVAWIDRFGDTPELVLQSGEGFKANDRAFRLALPAIDRLAQRNGCRTIRSHPSDAKKLAILKRNGFAKAEVVVRRVVR